MIRYKLATIIISFCLYLMIYNSPDCLGASLGNISKLNLVLISIDSLRADHMGLYGYQRDTTPNIDRFAKNAIVFDKYFSTSYLTPISEMSVHTGTYPLTNGLINFESYLSANIKTLAEILKDSGWKTAAIGSSFEFGFPIMRQSFSRGFDLYKQSGKRGQVPVQDAISWMNNNIKNDQPFFLWLNVGTAHWPYGEGEPPHFSDPEYNGFFKTVHTPANIHRGVEVFSNFNMLFGLIYQGKRYDRRQNIISDNVKADITYALDRYDDGIVKTDRILKDLFDFLSTTDNATSTIVIIQSEHGEDFGEHGYIAHYDITETQTHVPLIIKIPNLKATRDPSLISGVDILPTILCALGLSHKVLDGVNYYPHMTNSALKAPRNDLFLIRSPLWERAVSYNEPWLNEFIIRDNMEHFYDTAIRTSEWKLIHRLSREILSKYSWYGALTGKPIEFPEYELYHISTDPLEQNNIYSPFNPVFTLLKKKLNSWEKKSKKHLPRTQTRSIIQLYF